MKRFRYRFDNGELKTVEVEDGIFEVLRGFENEEARQRMESHRHCCHFELNDEDEEIGIYDPNQDLDTEDNELKHNLEIALGTLTSRQREVAELIMDGKNFMEIAKEFGVSKQSINDIKVAIKNRLLKVFDFDKEKENA
jgi:RNA polymerase sigma factor (sigma-70 family)